MLKYRLLFGTLMTIFFAGVVIFDGWLDGSLTSSAPVKPQGTIFCILISLLVVAAQFEFAKLADAKKIKIFLPVSIIASVFLATSWYWPQFIKIPLGMYIVFVLAFTLLALFLYQYLFYGTEAVIANCGVNYFSIIYFGLLGGFCVALRIEFGVWALLMFVFVVKCADIGAYTFGKLFGNHKFSPKISPGKTWEGMAGAVFLAIIVSVIFALSRGIMAWWLAVIFGFCFAFIGQLGDLAESLIKRDAQQKDSANNVPGFGGILDVIDSPLGAAFFAYLFFLCCSK